MRKSDKYSDESVGCRIPFGASSVRALQADMDERPKQNGPPERAVLLPTRLPLTERRASP
jgi:hypothetical protein